MRVDLPVKKVLLISLFLLSASLAKAGQISLGFAYDGWNSDYKTTSGLNTVYGSELWVPLSLNLNLAKGVQAYGQGLFGNGTYTYPPDNTGTNANVNLTNLADSVIGTEIQFNSFGYASLLNVSFNLPTGDSTWENKQTNAIIPTEFMDYRYRGRAFGFDMLYALSIPAGKNSLGLGGGFTYSNAFTDSPLESVQLGDTAFLVLNFVQPGMNGYKEIARLSGYYSLTTQIDGTDDFQLGTNLNASYSWFNPNGLSLDTGVMYFFPCRRLDENNQLVTEADNYYAPRLYAAPSFSVGEIKIAAQVKYVFQNANKDPTGTK